VGVRGGSPFGGYYESFKVLRCVFFSFQTTCDCVEVGEVKEKSKLICNIKLFSFFSFFALLQFFGWDRT